MTMTTISTKQAQPDLEMDGGGFDDLYNNGGGEKHDCEWDEGICDEVSSYYVISFCDDPNCHANHKRYYCMRHYALQLSRQLGHLEHCPAYDEANTPEERRLLTLKHIAGWGHLTGIR